jgi:hypothetical protein
LLAIVLAAAGCASPPVHGRTVAPPAAPVLPVSDRPLREQAAAELGPEIAAALPPIVREPPRPIDPGALRLVNSIVDRLPTRPVDDGGVTRVNLAGIRNLSHSDAREFTAFLDRFAGVLSRAGRDARLTFTAGDDIDDEVAHYDMVGTAYLVSADGFDQWELFLTVTPVGRPLTLWQSEGPVRVLRQARRDQPQVFLLPPR